MSILLFFAVLFILILVHEWGHFIVAKKTGMRVDEFGIGFPPRLFSLKKGETEYTFNALPIGGFVRIWGENGEDRSETDSSVDTSRGFNARPKWAQALVLIAGVTMNILFAWFLFSIINMLGVPVPVDEATATDAAELYVIGTISQSPAAVIPVGAVINTMMVGSELLSRPTPSEFTTVVQQAGETTVSVEYTSAGNTTTAELIPVRGLIESDPERYAVGASLSLVEVEKMGLVAAVTDGFSSTWHGLVSIATGLWSLISQIFVGDADFSQVAGPVGIVGMVGDAASFGIAALLTFTAKISLNLAVINLLPFPALDGGRLVFVLIEAVTKKQIPLQWAGRVNLVGFALLMLLMIVVTYNDIIRIL